MPCIFWEGKIGADPKCFHRDSTTGLSKSITETHNKESTCDEARPSLWDVFNSGRVTWVSGTYWRFIIFSGDTFENLYVYVPSRKKGQPTRMVYLLAACLRGFCHANQLLLHHFLRCCRNCYWIAWLILKLLLVLAGWPALFQKNIFLTWNSGLQSTCLTDRLLREMDPIWTACRLRFAVRALATSTRNLKSGNLFFLTKNWPWKYLLTIQVCNSLGWFLDEPHRAKFCGPEALYCLSVHGFFVRIFLAHCNRQIGL